MGVYGCPICQKFVYDMQKHYELCHPTKFACYTCDCNIFNIFQYTLHIKTRYHYNDFYGMHENVLVNIDELSIEFKKIPKDIINLIITYIPAHYDSNNIVHKDIVLKNSF